MKDVRVYFATTKPNWGWASELLESLELNDGMASTSIYYQPFWKDRVMVENPKIYYAGPIWHPNSSMEKEFEKATTLFCYIDETGINQEMTYLIAYAVAHKLKVFFYIKNDCGFEIWDEHPLVAHSGVVYYVKDVQEAFEQFVESHQPLLTDKQFSCLDGLIRTVSPYFEVLVNQEFSDCYDSSVLKKLSSKKAFHSIKNFIDFQDEAIPYFIKSKRDEIFKERVKRWKSKLCKEEVDCLFSDENKKSLSEMINFMNEVFETRLKDIESVEVYVRKCLDREKDKKEKLKNRPSKAKSNKVSSVVERLKHDGTVESEKKLIEVLKQSPERVCSIENVNETLWLVAIEQSPQLLRRMTNQTFKTIKKALKQDNLAIDSVSSSYEVKTSEEANELVKLHGLMLKHVPNSLKTAQLCEIAINQTVHAFPYVPLRYQTQEMCECCVCVEPRFLAHVKPKHMTVELCEKAIMSVKDEEVEGLVEALLSNMSDEFALALVKKNGTYLKYLPMKKRKTMIRLAAFEQTPKALEWIPKNKITDEMIKKAMEYNPELVRFVSKRQINNEMVLKAVNHNPELIYCFDEKWLSEEIKLIYAKKQIFRWIVSDKFFNLNDYSKEEQLGLIRLNPTLVFTAKSPDLDLIIAAQNRFLDVDFIFNSGYEWFAFDLERKIETECEIPCDYRGLVLDNLNKIERKIKELY